MIDVAITIPESEMQRLSDIIMRYQRELRKSVPAASRIAVTNVITSLGAQTKKSRPRRQVTADPLPGQRRGNAAGLKRYKVHNYRHGQPRPFYKFGRTKGEIVQSRWAKIKYAKLAWRSWGWAKAALYNRPKTGQSGYRCPEGAVYGRLINTRDDFSALIGNRIGYMRQALAAGEASVGIAMDKAARSMMYKLDNDLTKVL